MAEAARRGAEEADSAEAQVAVAAVVVDLVAVGHREVGRSDSRSAISMKKLRSIFRGACSKAKGWLKSGHAVVSNIE
jgi:hypothetical protein